MPGAVKPNESTRRVMVGDVPLGERVDLREVGRHVVGRRVEHRLHRDGRAAAQGHAAHHDPAGGLVRFGA